MAATRPSSVERRPRRGTLAHPVNARLYRGTWLLVGIPLLVAAFSVARPSPLAPPALPPAFDATTAQALTHELSQTYPDRSPGSSGAAAATAWVIRQLTPFNLPIETDRFRATIPGLGGRQLVNVAATVTGQSPDTIVVLAHRDDTGEGPGASDNASGTAALILLARTYAATQASTATSRGVAAAHRIVFLSTDGGAFGGLGARRFLKHSPVASHVVAVIDLDAIAGNGRPRVATTGDFPRSPAPKLVQTAADRLATQTGMPAGHDSALAQLLDLAFPFSLTEQAPFVGHGIPAIAITTSATRPAPPFTDRPELLNAERLAAIGRATQDLLGSLDAGLELTRGTTAYVWLGDRLIRGWAIELVLIAALLPFLTTTVDLFARTRRLRVRLRPGFQALRTRVLFWLFVGFAFLVFALLGAWPSGDGAPVAPGIPVARDWPTLALSAFAIVIVVAWRAARGRLVPRRPTSAEERLAGHTAALLFLAVVSLFVIALNPFALFLVLPSLHLWLWLPQIQGRIPLRVGLWLLGLAGPALMLWSFGHRYGLGLHAPWYLMTLVTVGYVQAPSVVVFLLWLAGGAQLAALAAGRYASYPDRRERGRHGPVRNLVRTVVLTARHRRASTG